MEVEEVLAELEAAGKEGTAAIYRRHGANGEVWGVPYSVLDKLKKRIGVDHRLARALWKSRVHDARALALKVCDPEAWTVKQLEGLLKAGTNHVLMGPIGGVAARRPDAHDLARRWIDGQGEWVRSAGWVVICELAMAGKVEVEEGRAWIERVGAELPTSFNRERHNQNAALIALGGTLKPLHGLAQRVARKLGTVEVDHGETSCKTPAAIPYMQKMWTRAAEKAARAKQKAAAKKKATAGKKVPAARKPAAKKKPPAKKKPAAKKKARARSRTQA